jgi:hypothetical protein
VLNFVCLFIAHRVEGTVHEPVTPNDLVDDVENVSEDEDYMEPKLEMPTE